MIKTWSKKIHGNINLTQNFKVAEFACRDGSDTVIIDDALAVLLQKIRAHFGTSVTINSGYRTPSYNAKVGGAKNSQHTKGTAADICINGVSPEEVAKYAEYILGTNGGIGLYKTFTHVDTREKRARWDSRSGKESAVSGFYGYAPLLKNADEIAWELNHRHFKITDMGGFIKELDKAKTKNSPLYWGYYKLVNGR